MTNTRTYRPTGGNSDKESIGRIPVITHEGYCRNVPTGVQRLKGDVQSTADSMQQGHRRAIA